MTSNHSPSQFANIPLKQANEIGGALVELQEQIRKLTQEVAWVRESTPRNPYRWVYNARPIDIEYSSSHVDFNDKEWRPRRLRHPRDDLQDLKVEAPEFDGNLNPKNYLDWVQALERIFELKDYNDEKAFKLAILKKKGYASLLYEHLKKSRSTEARSTIKT